MDNVQLMFHVILVIHAITVLITITSLTIPVFNAQQFQGAKIATPTQDAASVFKDSISIHWEVVKPVLSTAKHALLLNTASFLGLATSSLLTTQDLPQE